MLPIELLAPAGDLSCVETALYFGADAVYFGGPGLQLRADKVGFTLPELETAVEKIHARGKKAYVTVNSFAKNEEISFAGDYAAYLHACGVDAAIVSDLGVLAAIKKAAPELDVHISTQANCTNYLTARTYHDLGASRVVLARELTLTEIAELRAKTPAALEIECFIHGAMCMSYSGRCMISSFLTGRSGNRGACTQPCRWEYALMEKTRPGEYFPVYEDEKGTEILSSHDLCCIEFLDQLAAAGVTSFKIEGRMKSNYYVASVIDAYRHALDGTRPVSDCRLALEDVTHRPYSSGFYFGEEKLSHTNDGQYHAACTFVAEVLGWSDGIATLRQRNHFALGQTLEILSPAGFGLSFPVTRIENEEGGTQETAPHPLQILRIPCPHPLHAGDFLRRREA